MKKMQKTMMCLVAVSVLGVAYPLVQNEKQVVSAEQVERLNERYWQTAFEENELGNWQDVLGKINKSIEDQMLKVKRDTSGGNNAVTLNLDSPQLADGEVEVKFKYNDTDLTNGRTGVIFRGQNKDIWGFAGYNTGNWLIESAKGWKDTIPGPRLENNKTYVLKVVYKGKKVTLSLNTEEFWSGEVDFLPREAGHIGTRLWYDQKTTFYSSFKNGEIGSIPEISKEITDIEEITLFTQVGQLPNLPETLVASYTTGETESVEVQWDTIADEMLQKEGQFTLEGTVESTTIKAKATINVIGESELEQGESIQSEDLTAIIDPQFPRVIRYEEDGKPLFKGQGDKLKTIVIDKVAYQPDVKFSKTAEAATYQLNIKELGLSFDVNMAVKKGQEFQMTVSNVSETSHKIHAISIPNQGLISVDSTQPGAAFAGVRMHTAINGSSGKNGDTLLALDKVLRPDANPEKYMYGFLNDNQVAAAFWTNATNDGTEKSDSARIIKETRETKGGYNTILSSGDWTYRPDGDDSPYNEMDELPAVKLKFAKDLNNDQKVDWQDSAIAFRSIMNTPKGAEVVPEMVVQRIPFNFASQATNPFLTTLDETKRLAAQTDGLGQLVLLKGYQSEGHDSAHPDFGLVGKRQGGAKEMNQLVEEGHKYNAKFGVHINNTEAHPEAKYFSEELVNKNGVGWSWLDKSYYIKTRPDAISGNRYNRLKELKTNVPNLDYVYVDVWGIQGWEGRRFAKEINSLDWFVTNEFPSAFEYDSLWNHWSAEKAYGGSSTKGFNSNIVRFIRNHQKDTWIISENPLLGGAEFEAHEGWVGKINQNSHVAVTFGINLPTKFLQHYQITNWETKTSDKGQINGTIKLTDNVVVTNETPNQQRLITKDGVTILKGQAYLLPWQEEAKDKLYHWNETGGETTWQLLNEWADRDNLHLFELTDQGRVDQGKLAVTNGRVTIQAKAKTAYVIDTVENNSAEPEYGQYTALKDPGFNAKETLARNWTIEKGKPVIEKNANGDYLLVASKEELSIRQILKPLKAGKYSLYLNAETKNRQVTVEVATDGGSVTQSFGNSIAQNYIAADVNHTQTASKSYMQKSRVDFEVIKETDETVIRLKAAPGSGKVQFDDLRIVPRNTDLTTDKAGNNVVLYQDFEDEQGIGFYPFVQGEAGGVADHNTHLSELNAPFTQKGWNNNVIDDVIEGKWSLKLLNQASGLMLQTLPQTVLFEKGKNYEVSFDYQSDGRDNDKFKVGFMNGEYVKNQSNLNDPDKFDWRGTLPFADATRQFRTEFTGDQFAEASLVIFNSKPNVAKEPVQLVIDNLLIKEIGEDVLVTDFKLSTNSLVTLKKGKELEVNASFTPENATNQKLEWHVEKSEVISLDNGTIKGLKTGLSKVTATASNGQKINFVVRVTP